MSRTLPILCATPVVRAILDGRQTQDRRPVKPQPAPGHTLHTCWTESWKQAGRVKASWEYWAGPVYEARPAKALCGSIGAVAPWSYNDVLYVRETWRPYIRGWSSHVQYRAGNQHLDRPVCGPSLGSDASDAAMEWCATRGGVNEIECKNPDDAPWFPSIHMPKWAARIHLRVLSVTVERVNAISEEDAMAEGCEPSKEDHIPLYSRRATFERLWDSLYGEDSFRRGDWCWVTRFERVTP